jgi:hypothetical protein
MAKRTVSKSLSCNQGAIPDPGYAVQRESATAPRLILPIQERLVALGLVERHVPLADLHRHLPPEAMVLNEHYTNAVSRAFYTPDEAIVAAYHEFIAHLYRHGIPGFCPGNVAQLRDAPWRASRLCSAPRVAAKARDFLFQAQPIVRFHFPVRFPATMKTKQGLPRQLHSDILGGHPRQMIQGWVALSDASGSAALQCSTRADGLALLDRYRESFGPDAPPFADSLQQFYGAWDTLPGFAEALTRACNPITMSAGDALFFDPHCIHGGTQNDEGKTRVSLDFRLLPVSMEEECRASAETPTQERFRRGALFHKQSAGELFGN